jgi:hypothetical protein
VSDSCAHLQLVVGIRHLQILRPRFHRILEKQSQLVINAQIGKT